MVIMPNLCQNGEGSNNNGVKPEHRKTRRGFGPPSPERKKVAAAAGDGPSESSSSLTSQLRSLRKRSAASSDDPTSTPEKKSAGPAAAATGVTHSRTNSTVKQSSDDLSTSTSRHTSPEKRPPVKLTVKFKDVNRFGH